MDKAITTTFMIIVSIIVSVMVFNSVYPAAVRSSESLNIMRGRMDDRMKTQIEIVHASAELNGGAWQDVNGDGNFDIFVWVKNVGSNRIVPVERMDIFFGPEGNFTRLPHIDEVSGSLPHWEWQIENDTQWNPTATLRITINYSAPLSSGRYFIKIALPSGLSDSFTFSM